jgi:hypothetical protein
MLEMAERLRMLGKEVAELRRGDSLRPGAASPQMRKEDAAPESAVGGSKGVAEGVGRKRKGKAVEKEKVAISPSWPGGHAPTRPTTDGGTRPIRNRDDGLDNGGGDKGVG